MSIPVCFQDASLIVVDKPAGLLSVPGRKPELQDCVWSRLQEQFPDHTVGLVHRLDRDTSGLMVFSLQSEAQKKLGQLFERRRVTKEYLARVQGCLTPEAGEIHAPIRKDWTRNDPPVYVVCTDRGKSAITRFQVEEATEQSSRVRLFPLTGRSHQLRVHLHHLGHPILGDPIYGDGVGPMQLRAVRLCFPHPITGETVDVLAPANAEPPRE
jgi:tRNA pseudouridine32 synthase/23S rRNA pseudouridine746 synthase